MTLDEAIAEARDNAKTQRDIAEECFEEHIFDEKERIEHLIYANEFEQLAEWLEELKAYKSDDFTKNLQTLVYKQGYNKAIDDFTGEIKDWQIDIQDNEYDAEKFDFVFERIYEIAEQLKAGENREYR